LPRREDDFGDIKYKRESTPFAKGVLSLYVFCIRKKHIHPHPLKALKWREKGSLTANKEIKNGE
jgi:hypothetical protein